MLLAVSTCNLKRYFKKPYLQGQETSSMSLGPFVCWRRFGPGGTARCSRLLLVRTIFVNNKDDIKNTYLLAKRCSCQSPSDPFCADCLASSLGMVVLAFKVGANTVTLSSYKRGLVLVLQVYYCGREWFEKITTHGTTLPYSRLYTAEYGLNPYGI